MSINNSNYAGKWPELTRQAHRHFIGMGYGLMGENDSDDKESQNEAILAAYLGMTELIKGRGFKVSC